MPIRLPSQIKRKFSMKETDRKLGGFGTYVVFRAITVGDFERIDLLWLNERRTIRPDGEVVYYRSFTAEDVRITQIILSMVDCNLADMDGNNLFSFDNGAMVDNDENRSKLMSLDLFVMDELYRFCVITNPFWYVPLE